MLGANGGIKVTSKYDKKFLIQIYRLNLILYTAAAVLAIANFVFSLCIAPYSDQTIIINIVLSSVLLLCVAFLFVTGILAIRKQLKLEKVVEFELFSNFMSVAEFEHGKLVGDGKVYYDSIVKSSVRGKFFVVDCGKPTMNGGAPYYLSQVSLTGEEINTVSRLLKIAPANAGGEVPVADGEKPVALPESEVNPDAEPINAPQNTVSVGGGEAQNENTAATGGEGGKNG